MKLGSPDSALSFSTPQHDGSWAGVPRRLRLDNDDAFDLAFWCGTCAFVFERLEGSSRTLSSEELQSTLNSGLETINDDILDAASLLVPEATYLPTLLKARPRAVTPSGIDDYFSNEQVEHRGINGFWGLPENPRTPYYRGSDWQTDPHEFAFEFFVPMVPPSWNDRDQVSFYEQVLPLSSKPTVLVLSIADHTGPHNSFDGHTGLIHFILDGHHKIEAAARLDAEISILSLLSLDHGLSHPDAASKIFDHFEPNADLGLR